MNVRKVLVAAGTALAILGVTPVSPAAAVAQSPSEDGVVPTLITDTSNNASLCSVNYPGTEEIKFDSPVSSGQLAADGITVTLTRPSALAPSNANSVDWSATGGVIVAVLVKDGVDGTNNYNYGAGDTGDRFLTTPNNGAKGISNVKFCYSPEELGTPQISTQLYQGDTPIPDDGEIDRSNIPVFDTATLTGATADAGGTVTYYYQHVSDDPDAIPDPAVCDDGTQFSQVDVTNGVVPDSSGLGFQNANAGVYEIWAVYSGDSNNEGATSECGTETLILRKAQPTVTTQVKIDANTPVPDDAVVPVGTTVIDTVTVTSVAAVYGSITYYVEEGDPDCTTEGATQLGSSYVLNGQATFDSNDFTFTSAGTYEFWVVYSGSGAVEPGSSVCGSETVIVREPPGIRTQVKRLADDSDVPDDSVVKVGTSVYDTAQLTGLRPGTTGTVTYYVEKGDPNCTPEGATPIGTVPVIDGVVGPSDPFTFLTAGTYEFWAVFTLELDVAAAQTDRENGIGLISECGSETVVVKKYAPRIRTQIYKAGYDETIVRDGGTLYLGKSVFDTAWLLNASPNPGGRVTYYVKKQATGATTPDCSPTGATALGTVNVANGVVPRSLTYTPGSVGTYEFWAVYSGDAANKKATSVCGTETVVVKRRVT